MVALKRPVRTQTVKSGQNVDLGKNEMNRALGHLCAHTG